MITLSVPLSASEGMPPCIEGLQILGSDAAMQMKAVAAGRKALLGKCPQIWGWHLCSSYLILSLGFLLSLFCFAYFDVVRFTPSALLLSLSSIRSFSHSPAFPSKARPPAMAPSPLLLSNQSLSHHHLHRSIDGEVSEESLHTKAPSASHSSSTTTTAIAGNQLVLHSGKEASPPFADAMVGSRQTSSTQIGESSEPTADSIKASTSFPGPQTDSSKRADSKQMNSSGASDLASELNEVAGTSITEEEGECNLYEGKWIRDDEEHPLYRSQACPFIDEGFRCQENGRPDDGYQKWRWQPSACNIPSSVISQ